MVPISKQQGVESTGRQSRPMPVYDIANTGYWLADGILTVKENIVSYFLQFKINKQLKCFSGFIY